MTVTLLVQLWAVPGREQLLVDYEDQVLGRLPADGAGSCSECGRSTRQPVRSRRTCWSSRPTTR